MTADSGASSPVASQPATENPTPNQPYYQDELVTLYHGDCLDDDALRSIWAAADVLLTDPPYGIAYNSGSRRDTLAASIVGDENTDVRDAALTRWMLATNERQRPALVFGTWRIARPGGTKARLVWDTKGALGMGDLSIPWKPSDQEIYVLGKGFAGRRDSNVLTCAPVQSMATNGRHHPHEKPVALLVRLLDKCPPGVVLDPFAGSGSTLVAAKQVGRRCIGVEVEERYCEIAAQRLQQDALPFGGAA